MTSQDEEHETIARRDAGIDRSVGISNSNYHQDTGEFYAILEGGFDWLNRLACLPGNKTPTEVTLEICGNIRTKDYVVSVGLSELETDFGFSIFNLRGDLALRDKALQDVSLSGSLILGDRMFDFECFRYADNCWGFLGELWLNDKVTSSTLLKAFDGGVKIPGILPEVTVSKCSIVFLKEHGSWTADFCLAGAVTSLLPSDSFVLQAARRGRKGWSFDVALVLHKIGKEEKGIILQGGAREDSIELSGAAVSPKGVALAELVDLLTEETLDPGISELGFPSLKELRFRILKEAGKSVSCEVDVQGRSLTLDFAAL
ncbi:hypothetical protein [Streptomyces sp. NPDC059003]|uniref:hypothetical protein n=1 Tax=Streptomyces sp. NPDC059003 TaxID=3346691 RepID=UPI0036D1A650